MGMILGELNKVAYPEARHIPSYEEHLERGIPEDTEGNQAYAEGWNACLRKCKELNSE